VYRIAYDLAGIDEWDACVVISAGCMNRELLQPWKQLQGRFPMVYLKRTRNLPVGPIVYKEGIHIAKLPK
jgi:hypothetical protein